MAERIRSSLSGSKKRFLGLSTRTGPQSFLRPWLGLEVGSCLKSCESSDESCRDLSDLSVESLERNRRISFARKRSYFPYWSIRSAGPGNFGWPSDRGSAHWRPTGGRACPSDLPEPADIFAWIMFRSFASICTEVALLRASITWVSVSFSKSA